MDTGLLCAAIGGAAFVVAVCAAAGMIMARKNYICRVCGNAFRSKWYKIILAPQHNGDRLLYCEKCGCLSWSKREKRR
ncbi:MAG: hypothetical protein J5922_00440 [Clostridia bacterium]|nr:hypothetical protein [Clostridia bacterium]